MNWLGEVRKLRHIVNSKLEMELNESVRLHQKKQGNVCDIIYE